MSISKTDNKPFSKSLLVPSVDCITNARLKSYLAKDVLQVCNDDIFVTGNFEPINGKKRLYDVSRPGAALDPERSLEESKRRAKSAVTDIALCNRFTHMFTWTLDGDLVDRYDSAAVYHKVRVFLSNVSRRKGFRYVCIPEYHTIKAGEVRPAIHMHGLCSLGDVPLLPAIKPDGKPHFDGSGRQVFNMPDWSLGWSTAVALDDNYERAVGYITKYITKCDNKIFGKWYLSSRFLQKAPDIIPLERIDFNTFRDTDKLLLGEQVEMNVYLDVKIVSEDYGRTNAICGA